MHKRRGPNIGCLAIIIGIFMFGIVSVYGSILTKDAYITVDSKERQCNSSEDKIECNYVVFSKEGEIYDNTDTIFHLKFDSGSLQAKLQSGKTYKVKLVGWRIPVLSIRQNIISAEEVTS